MGERTLLPVHTSNTVVPRETGAGSRRRAGCRAAPVAASATPRGMGHRAAGAPPNDARAAEAGRAERGDLMPTTVDIDIVLTKPMSYTTLVAAAVLA